MLFTLKSSRCAGGTLPLVARQWVEKATCVIWCLDWAGSYEAWPPDVIFTPLLLKLLHGGMIQW